MNHLIDRIWGRPRGVVNAAYKTINDFESSSEKECSKFDKENEKIYSKLLNQAEKAHNAIKNSGLSMNLEVPIPPRPSNRDRYLLWKKRNVSKKVIDQTEAVLFLESQGYKYNEHYEAYQAIDLAIEIKKNHGESFEIKDTSKNFDNVYNKNDKNIFRRRSMYRLKENESLPSELQNKSPRMVINEEFNPSQVNRDSAPVKNLRPATFGGSRSVNTQNYRPYCNSDSQAVFINQSRPTINFPGIPSAPQPERVSPSSPCQSNSPHIVQRRIIQLDSTQIPSQNFTKIQTNNKLINDVKPSAPPASKNLTRNLSYLGFEEAPK